MFSSVLDLGILPELLKKITYFENTPVFIHKKAFSVGNCTKSFAYVVEMGRGQLLRRLTPEYRVWIHTEGSFLLHPSWDKDVSKVNSITHFKTSLVSDHSSLFQFSLVKKFPGRHWSPFCCLFSQQTVVPAHNLHLLVLPLSVAFMEPAPSKSSRS